MSLAPTYTVQVDCSNCRAPNIVNIEKGKTVRQAVDYGRGPGLNFDVPVCVVCGVRALDADTALAIVTT